VDIAWVKDIEEVGSTTMNFPIFSDTDRSVCEQFGMLMVSELNDIRICMPLIIL
jgi:alkyl hydroperoxide reductase subunit AhpC